jgi:hypothetical protein
LLVMVRKNKEKRITMNANASRYPVILVDLMIPLTTIRRGVCVHGVRH